MSVILCNADGLRPSAVATIRSIALPLRELRIFAGFPAVISIMKVLLDLDAASLTPGNRTQSRMLPERKKAPAFGMRAGAAFCGAASKESSSTGTKEEAVKKKPVVSASLSDIREDTIVLTGSMSLVATALFGDSGQLMKFLQANIPASAVAADQRYRKWVFALSKAGPMRLAQHVASQRIDKDDDEAACIFPCRIPSWRAHWRGDRAYLVHLDLIPRVLDALQGPGTMRLIKDPSLRFDPDIPWEVCVEGGRSLNAVWRDAHAKPVRTVKIERDGDHWRLEEGEKMEGSSEDSCGAGAEAWLEYFLHRGS